MKKKMLIILSLVLLVSGCGSKKEATQETEETKKTMTVEFNASLDITFDETKANVENLDESDLNSDDVLQYSNDVIYEKLIEQLGSDYYIQNIETAYISKEYIEELEYNSKSNIFFGYTLEDLTKQFGDKKYVFTLGDDGTTIVTEVENPVNYMDKVIKNVAIGTGVILVCVTVSSLTAASAPAVSVIFAMSAKGAVSKGIKAFAVSGVASGVITGVQTGNFDLAVQSALENGSEAFKWGAIAGAITGGVSEGVGLYDASLNGLTMDEAAIIQREGYPLDIIRNISSMEEYQVYKDAGLVSKMVNGKLALIRDIDINYESIGADGQKMTNLQRMVKGLAPIDPLTGKSYELHHVNQMKDGTLAILSPSEHSDNYSVLHKLVECGVHNESCGGLTNTVWNEQRKAFWQALAKGYGA